MGTGTWNPSRVTTIQGQSTKRHSNKKNFKSGQKQPNTIFCFVTFRNHRQKNSRIFHIYKCGRFRKQNKKRAPELGIPTEWQHSKASRRNVTQTKKTAKAIKINQMLYSFSSLSESSAKYFNVASHLQVSQIPKIKSKRAPELRIPAEWQHSKASRRNVTQTRKISKAFKINQMICSFSQLSKIIGKIF